MESYRSKYTGEEIDAKLDKVTDTKINTNNKDGYVLENIELDGRNFIIPRGHTVKIINKISERLLVRAIMLADGTFLSEQSFGLGTHVLKNVVSMIITSTDNIIKPLGCFMIKKNRESLVWSNIFYKETSISNINPTSSNNIITDSNVNLIFVRDGEIHYES